MSDIDRIIVKLEYITEKVTAIHHHAEKTNGRVSRLENWRSYATGAMAVIVFLSGYIIIAHDAIVDSWGV